MEGKQPRYRLSFSKGTNELHGPGDKEADMTTDDLHAMGWIALGSVASALITTAILVAPVSVHAAPSSEPAYMDVPTVAPMAGRAVIDFAIIRGYPETMVESEGPATGWTTPPADPDARARR
jgi:hypothetical protein